jgi:feruloyl esterase
METIRTAASSGRIGDSRVTRLRGALALTMLTTILGLSNAPAAGIARLAVVKPVMQCDALARVNLTAVAGAAVTIKVAKTVQSAAGAFCRVMGNVAPTIGFTVNLPIDSWQQRYLQSGCGGLCGSDRPNAEHAGSCTPALTGGLVVASDDMGHTNEPNVSGGLFGLDPQKRIDFAYRGNHVTALISKALIKAFYGQPARYSYFSGCSDGGREALVEAQRYPEDFNGIAAGAPAMNFQVQNSFYHGWQYDSNTRADGTHVLLSNRLPILHEAAVAECNKQAGTHDDVIADPRACKFDPAIVQCRAGGTDTSRCLTAAEVAVARKLYDGPVDAAGHHFTVGGPQLGSELAWTGLYVAEGPTANMGSKGMAADSSRYLIYTDSTEAEGDIPNFSFTQENFARVSVLAPLYDSTDTDLSVFRKDGGKLLLWHGWSDQHISPINTIAYYQALMKQMGAAALGDFTRMFLFPGVYHCGGGEGYTQFDVLAPLMAWVEGGDAPSSIIAGKVPPTAERGPGGRQGNPADAPAPLALADVTPLATRPVFAYPMLASYGGKGDVNAASSYLPVLSKAAGTPVRNWEGAHFYAPGFLKNYAVVDGKLTVSGAKN